jgi:hypothetical protein
MMRLAAGLSLIVVLACFGLGIVMVRSEDSMAGAGLVALAFFAILAIGVIWLLVGGWNLLRLIRSQTKSFRQSPPEDDAKPSPPPRLL